VLHAHHSVEDRVDMLQLALDLHLLVSFCQAFPQRQVCHLTHVGRQIERGLLGVFDQRIVQNFLKDQLLLRKFPFPHGSGQFTGHG
jgi:hypothetical protein